VNDSGNRHQARDIGACHLAPAYKLQMGYHLNPTMPPFAVQGAQGALIRFAEPELRGWPLLAETGRP
jgi:hypothetical protein